VFGKEDVLIEREVREKRDSREALQHFFAVADRRLATTTKLVCKYEIDYIDIAQVL
jgi:hypothetical protein